MLLAVLLLLLVGLPFARAGTPRDTLFNDDWCFHLGDVDDARRPDHDDRSWRRLDLPHDWSIEDLPRDPDRVMMGSESFPKDALRYWNAVEQHPYVIGEFVWTVMDCLGESGLTHTTPSNEPDTVFKSWLWCNAWCSDLDICGFRMPQSLYRDVVWRRSPVELLVREPLPPGITETVSWWGWPSEVPS